MSPTAQPRFARVAAAIGDPTRAVMLSRLLDGRHYTARELAEEAGVSAPTASQHLKLLVDERVLRVRAQGRHRYFTLADGNVGQALEALLRVADAALPESTRWQAPSMRDLRYARSCYGHLAGSLGVQLCETFVQRGWVDIAGGDGLAYSLTAKGVAGLAPLGLASLRTDVDLAGRRGVGGGAGKRALYGCVDWSERREHFAGPLAVAMLDAFIERGWLARVAETRVLSVTRKGRESLVASFIGHSPRLEA